MSSVASPGWAHVAPLTEGQMVHGSEHIVVAMIEGAEARWNEQHTLIHTEYTLQVEDRLKGEAPERLRISMPGGALDGEEHDTCLSIPLEKGTRYLLFLHGTGRRSMTPITGAWQGLIREARTADGKSYAAPGGVLPAEERVEFSDAVEAARTLVARVKAEPAPEEPQPKAGRASLPAKTYDPSARADKAWLTTLPAAAPAPETPLLPWSSVAQTGWAEEMGPAGEEPGEAWEKYVYQGRPAAPIVVNQLPRNFFVSPHDEYQMAYWNVYAKNLFRIYVDPTNTWRFGNGVYDLAGFPDNSQMNQQFGDSWETGVLGITYRRFNGSGVIIEADVALNPAFQWTIDSRAGTGSANVWPFQHTMLHELGHVWGLKHPWETQDVWWDSVMNYTDRRYHQALLLADDAEAARAAYPKLKLRDGLLTSYSTQDASGNSASYVRSAPVPSVVNRGDSFSLPNPIKIENTGTAKLTNPTVEVYLVPQRFSWSNSIYLTTVRFSASIPSFHTTRLFLGTIRVPSGTPPGTYYLGFFLRDAKDKQQGNNGTWSNYDVTLTVR